MAGEMTVTIIGNLCADPDLKFGTSGKAYCRLRIAYTPREKDRQTNEWRDGEPMFVACTLFGQEAENVAESLSRGARVIAHGQLKQESWESNGEKRTGLKLEFAEVAPSLRYATAAVKKMQRSSQGGAPTGGGFDDPWATGAPASDRGRPTDDNPPF